MEKEIKELIVAMASYMINDSPTNKSKLRWAIDDAIYTINSAREETKSVSDNEAKKEVCEHPIDKQYAWMGMIVCKKCNERIDDE